MCGAQHARRARVHLVWCACVHGYHLLKTDERRHRAQLLLISKELSLLRAGRRDLGCRLTDIAPDVLRAALHLQAREKLANQSTQAKPAKPSTGEARDVGSMSKQPQVL